MDMFALSSNLINKESFMSGYRALRELNQAEEFLINSGENLTQIKENLLANTTDLSARMQIEESFTRMAKAVEYMPIREKTWTRNLAMDKVKTIAEYWDNQYKSYGRRKLVAGNGKGSRMDIIACHSYCKSRMSTIDNSVCYIAKADMGLTSLVANWNIESKPLEVLTIRIVKGCPWDITHYNNNNKNAENARYIPNLLKFVKTEGEQYLKQLWENFKEY